MDSNTINSQYRRETQSLCNRLGYTAHEIAVLVASQISVHYSYKINQINLIGFLNKGLLRGDVKEIQDATNEPFDESRLY